MTTVWITLFGLQIIAITALGLGFVLYRRIVVEHRIFIDSLEHTEQQTKHERIGFLAWFYILSTLAVAAATTGTLFLQSSFFP